ncbi:MAG: hypothetical protein P8X42_02335, partial [Calditrichaceae bacterium]
SSETKITLVVKPDNNNLFPVLSRVDLQLNTNNNFFPFTNQSLIRHFYRIKLNPYIFRQRLSIIYKQPVFNRSGFLIHTSIAYHRTSDEDPFIS